MKREKEVDGAKGFFVDIPQNLSCVEGRAVVVVPGVIAACLAQKGTSVQLSDMNFHIRQRYLTTSFLEIRL
jgi:hypothetical protein